jgi:hypothetical protein
MLSVPQRPTGKPLGVHTRMSIIHLAMTEYCQHGEFEHGWGVQTARRFMVSEATVSNLKYLAIEFLQQDQESPSLTIDDLLLGMPPGNIDQEPLLSEYELLVHCSLTS